MNQNALKKYNNFIEECFDRDTNPLISLVIKKPKWYSLKKVWFLLRFKDFLTFSYTPSFEFLCSIYDFIIYMENILIYPNEKENPIYAIRNLKNGVKSFSLKGYVLYGDDISSYATYIIDYTLYPDRSIGITIKRSWGDNVKTTISFKSGQPMLLSQGDQIMFDRIISDTMSAVVSTFDECYKRYKAIPTKEDVKYDQFIHQ